MRIWQECERDAGPAVLRLFGEAARTAKMGQLLEPANPEQFAAHYDLTISHPVSEQAPFAAFDRWLAEAAAEHGLTCALLHDGVVHEAIRRLGDGRLTIGFHLDYFALWHRPDDPYARLAQAVADAGGNPVNPPARSRLFTDKAAAHLELTRRGLGVPDTVLFRPETPDRPLTAAERARLRLDEPGSRLVVKPANGFGGKGVARVENPQPDNVTAALAVARNHDRQDTFLVQRYVTCPRLECSDGVERPAYWRVLYCLDELLPFWWSNPSGRANYRLLTRAEIRCHGLRPVLEYAGELARLSGLEWFSTELCLSDGKEPSRYRVRGDDGRARPVVAIDYVNDQCDVDVQSRSSTAPPDVVVRHVAQRFAEAAWLCRQTTVPAERARQAA